MESNIKKLSMREILSMVGFPITINEFRNTYKFNVDLKFTMEFEEQLKQIRKMSEIEKIICEYENIFDKEIYVFHLARLLEKDIENIKRAELLGKENIEQLVFTNDVIGKNKRRFFVNAKNLLKKCDVIDIVMKKKTKGEFEIYSSIDFVEQNTEFTDNLKTEAIKKMGIIEQEIGLKNVLKHINNSDLIDICKYPNLAILLMVEKENLEDKIKKHIQYIDLDKMLVIANAVYFYKYGENFYGFSKEEVDDKEDIFKSEITKNEDESSENTLETEEKVFGEIFELANLERTIEETTVENELQEIELQEAVEDSNVNTEEEKQEYSDSNNEYINKFINDNAKIVMNFENRKSTIFKLDENYSQETLGDGTTIFSLPNKRCYIIETTSDNCDLGGKATYIVNKDLFESKRNSLIENNSLKLKKLSVLKLNNNKDVTKLVYTGWENAITTFFNRRTEEKYTQEEKDNINRIIGKING